MTSLEIDKQHIWHPLTQHKTAPAPLHIKTAKKALLFDADGKQYIDAIASWYTAVYGHCNPYIAKKIKKQLDLLNHIVFTGFTHDPAITLSEKLVSILPTNQTKIFFNDNGSTAVEAALKMAFQFFHNKNEQRHTLIAFENAFHGDTFAAMSTSGLSVYNGAFKPLLLDVARIPVPTPNTLSEVLVKLNSILNATPCAAFIYEPLIQGAAGMKMYAPEMLDPILAMCKSKQVLCIADEVMTGFGKTGKHFASNWLTETPDIMCLSKALTAGVIPMGITSCSTNVFNAFYSDKTDAGFFHAHTYTANPIGCTAAIAGIDLLTKASTQKQIACIEESHQAFALKWKNDTRVKNMRVRGIILAFELNIKAARYGNLQTQIYNFCMGKGVYLRPLGHTLYIHPPYIISKPELQQVYKTLEAVIQTFSNK